MGQSEEKLVKQENPHESSVVRRKIEGHRRMQEVEIQQPN